MKTFCNNCPRACQIDRTKQIGFCNERKTLRIAKIIEHFSWEEPCLAKDKGTLAIFFSGCNLRCDYCQNFEISRGGKGKSYSVEEFCELIRKKQESHDSIDLITPTHFSDQLTEAFKKIEKKVPVIWNTNGYETEENVEKVSAFVDIFLTDMKYADNELGAKFSSCKDYISFALPSTKIMCKNKPDKFEGDFLLQGVILRHLVLPGLVENSFKILDIIKENFPGRMISLMSQFTPNGKSSLNRKLLPLEYKAVVTHLKKLKLDNGFTQDFESATQNFVPDFN